VTGRTEGAKEKEKVKRMKEESTLHRCRAEQRDSNSKLSVQSHTIHLSTSTSRGTKAEDEQDLKNRRPEMDQLQTAKRTERKGKERTPEIALLIEHGTNALQWACKCNL